MGSEIHEVEEGIYRGLLRLGRILLEIFVLAVGTGKQGETIYGQDGAPFRYVGDSPKEYLSLFGEITIIRAHYARERRAGLFPLHGVLNLPERKYSYAVQNRVACEAAQNTFQSASGWVKKHLGLEAAHRPIQRIVRDCTSPVEEFMESLKPPAIEEEGSILVHTVDCKGIPMRSGDRNRDVAKTEDKPGEKRMACVACGYSIDPHVRSSEAIVESFFKKSCSAEEKEKELHRPKPCHGRTVALLKLRKSEIFDRSERAVKSRIHHGTKETAVLMDGEKVLWNRSSERFSDWTEVLDFGHVMEKLWIAGKLQYEKPSPHVEEYVRERALVMLEGAVDLVIEDLLVALEDGTLSPAKAAELKSKVVGHLQDNRHRMAYADYLCRGLPIATGIVESTCKTLM